MNFLSVLFLVLFSHASMAALPEVIKIGTEGAYKPFNYLDQKGQLLGFDIDIARALCQEMKAKCEFITQDWDGIIPGLMLKKYDMIVASMSITDERKAKVDFSDPYYTTPAKFMAKKGVKLDVSKEGLKGKTIGVQRSTIHATYLKDVYKDIVKLKEYDTQENANMDLQSGRVDAILADSAVLYLWMKEQGNGQFEFTGPDLKDPKWFGVGAGIALRKGDKELATALNKALSTIKKNGVYDKIAKSYFPFNIKL
jgi:arginine/ornithine transport system substrate-binding protein